MAVVYGPCSWGKKNRSFSLAMQSSVRDGNELFSLSKYCHTRCPVGQGMDLCGPGERKKINPGLFYMWHAEGWLLCNSDTF